MCVHACACVCMRVHACLCLFVFACAACACCACAGICDVAFARDTTYESACGPLRRSSSSGLPVWCPSSTTVLSAVSEIGLGTKHNTHTPRRVDPQGGSCFLSRKREDRPLLSCSVCDLFFFSLLPHLLFVFLLFFLSFFLSLCIFSSFPSRRQRRARALDRIHHARLRADDGRQQHICLCAGLARQGLDLRLGAVATISGPHSVHRARRQRHKCFGPHNRLRSRLGRGHKPAPV